ncbi:hypothetical protein [Trinickia fusca]|nr:hypothetical protein [Trinickia fusca]
MKSMTIATRAATIAATALWALFTASVATAQTYGEPAQPGVNIQLSLGWHGDRYWDGHRYWEHDEWMRRHPHDHDPYRDRDHRHDDDHEVH